MQPASGMKPIRKSVGRKLERAKAFFEGGCFLQSFNFSLFSSGSFGSEGTFFFLFLLEKAG